MRAHVVVFRRRAFAAVWYILYLGKNFAVNRQKFHLGLDWAENLVS
jgi:hypothetical protein